MMHQVAEALAERAAGLTPDTLATFLTVLTASAMIYVLIGLVAVGRNPRI